MSLSVASIEGAQARKGRNMKHLAPIIAISLALGHSAISQAQSGKSDFIRFSGNQLELSKSHLNRELVWLPAIIESNTDVEPYLITFNTTFRFQRVDNYIQLSENPQGSTNLQINVLPTIYARFRIINETENSITFDFNSSQIIHYGLSKLHKASTSDSLYAISTLTKSAQMNDISNAQIQNFNSGDGWIAFEQLIGATQTTRIASAIIRHTFIEADKSKMVPILDDPNDDIGYFNTKRYSIGASEPKYIAHRFDPKKPLTFYISSNTPERYRQSIRDGILAWNKVFGWEYLHVAEAPAGARPGDIRYPMILWIEDSDVGLGIGQSQAHPITGEILTALITIREGWAHIFDVSKLESIEQKEESSFQIKGGQRGIVCNYTANAMTPDFFSANNFGNKITIGNSDLEQMELKQLRAVVMHEVGHTLGLRHNFAGSLDSDISFKNNEKDFLDFLNGERNEIDAPLPSSSIMDYLPLMDDLRMYQPGRYDRKALAYAYDVRSDSSDNDHTQQISFCTDEKDNEETEIKADCARRDSGAEPLDWAENELEIVANQISAWISDNILNEQHSYNPNQRNLWRLTVLKHRFSTTREIVRQYSNLQVAVSNGMYPYERQFRAAEIIRQFSLAPDERPIISEHYIIREPARTQVADLVELITNFDPNNQSSDYIDRVRHSMQLAHDIVDILNELK